MTVFVFPNVLFILTKYHVVIPPSDSYACCVATALLEAVKQSNGSGENDGGEDAERLHAVLNAITDLTVWKQHQDHNKHL